jgi:putative ABC transport system permease protein
MKYLPLIWAGLWRKRARTILTMLSVVVAFVLFGLLQGMNQLLDSTTRNLNVDRLYVTAKSTMTDGLSSVQANRIASVPGVRAVSQWTYFGGYYQNSDNPLPAFATDVDGLFKIYPELKVKPEYLQAMKSTRTGALISEQLAQQRGWKVGDRLPIGTTIWTNKGGSNTWQFDVVGTFDGSAYGSGMPGFYFNSSYFDENSAFGRGIVHYFLVGIEDPRQAVQISKAIDAMFENSFYETRTQTESQLAESQLSQIGDIDFIVHSIVGAVLFTLLFLTANTMMQSVRERTSELAVLKTLGFSDGGMLALVLVEALILCLFAGAVGLALAAVAFVGLRGFLGANASLPIVTVGLGAIVAVLLAFVSGFSPAWRAKRLNIVDALAGR